MSKKSKRLILEGKRMVINLKHSFHNPQNQPYSLLRHDEYLGARGYLRVRDETNRRSISIIDYFPFASVSNIAWHCTGYRHGPLRKATL